MKSRSKVKWLNKSWKSILMGFFLNVDCRKIYLQRVMLSFRANPFILLKINLPCWIYIMDNKLYITFIQVKHLYRCQGTKKTLQVEQQWLGGRKIYRAITLLRTPIICIMNVCLLWHWFLNTEYDQF